MPVGRAQDNVRAGCYDRLRARHRLHPRDLRLENCHSHTDQRSGEATRHFLADDVMMMIFGCISTLLTRERQGSRAQGSRAQGSAAGSSAKMWMLAMLFALAQLCTPWYQISAEGRQTVDSEALDGRDHVVAVDTLEAHVVARALLPFFGHVDEMTQESHVVRHLRIPDLNRLRHDCARWRTGLNCQGRVTVRECIRGCMCTFMHLPAHMQLATLHPVVLTVFYTEERDFHFLASIVGGGQQLNRQTLTHCQVVHMA